MTYNPHEPINEKRPDAFRPLLIQMRYSCNCANKEVLVESVYLDLNMPEEHFIWLVRRLRENVLDEVAQHLKK